jgi:hypothetical protein
MMRASKIYNSFPNGRYDMFRRFAHTASGTLFTLLVVTGVALFTGCGDLSRSPLVSDSGSVETIQEDAGMAASGGTFSIAFSPNRPDGSGLLTKPAGDKKLSKKSTGKKVKARKGGRLQVKLNHRGKAEKGVVRVQKVRLDVKRGSMKKDTKISMKVTSGTTLEDVLVEFGPSGLKFSQTAVLTIWVKGDIDEKKMKKLAVYHIEEDDPDDDDNEKEVSKARVRIKKVGKKTWKIIIKVPGFSDYDVDDGGYEEVDDEGWA